MKTQNHNFQHFTGKKGGKAKRKHKVKVKQNHINKYLPYNHRELDQEFLPRTINTKNTGESTVNAQSDRKKSIGRFMYFSYIYVTP